MGASSPSPSAFPFPPPPAPTTPCRILKPHPSPHWEKSLKPAPPENACGIDAFIPLFDSASWNCQISARSPLVPLQPSLHPPAFPQWENPRNPRPQRTHAESMPEIIYMSMRLFARREKRHGHRESHGADMRKWEGCFVVTREK